MPARALVPWVSSEEDGEGLDGEEDLVGALENCTQELNKLCGGLEVQQLETEDEYAADVDASTDTLASLEEMSSECAALLACLEFGGHSFNEGDDDDPEMLNESITGVNQPKEEKEGQLQLQVSRRGRKRFGGDER
ncbi:hypothetical protein PRIC1_003956 [Phytophthora ramorum]|uniref:uncharacterized protein n=1 Tax=Phytophthora ramorum TaxID=164328 RepID=UPI0030A70110|nr:hypothetical protein KRP23_3701 [Phytophthora ramorum]KAH7507967.1 hypothetical protein KRP22_3061 [Phytophthora ramorum]